MFELFLRLLCLDRVTDFLVQRDVANVQVRTPHESTLHHDPDCAMSFFVLLLASPFFLSQELSQGPNQAPLCLFQKYCGPLSYRGANNPHSETSALAENIHVFQKDNVGRWRVRRFLCSFDARLGFGLQTMPSWLTAVLPVSRPSTQ